MIKKTFELKRTKPENYVYNYRLPEYTADVRVCTQELMWLFTDFNPDYEDNRPIWITVSSEFMEDSVRLYAIHSPISYSFLEGLSYGKPGGKRSKYISTYAELDHALIHIFGKKFKKFYVKLEICDE